MIKQDNLMEKRTCHECASEMLTCVIIVGGTSTYYCQEHDPHKGEDISENYMKLDDNEV